MSQTMTQLVQRTITRLSMVSGIAVQTYSEDRIAEMIWHKFIMVRSELWWDEFMDYVTLTQDAQGRPTENVVRELPISPVGDEIVINKYRDIQHAWRPDMRDPMQELPRRNNPATAMRSGSTVYIMPDAAKVVRFGPFSPGMVMTLRVKRHYDMFLPKDVVPMDEQVLILGAAYDYLEDDGTNPGQTEKFRNMFNDRLRQLKLEENDRTIPLSPQPYYNGNGWQVMS